MSMNVEGKWEKVTRIILAVAFTLGAMIHVAIILGLMQEKAPLPLTIYFHSLTLLNLVVALGLIRGQKYGYIGAAGVALTQIPAHAYMIYLDQRFAYASGLSLSERLFDIGFALFVLGFVWHWWQRRKGSHEPTL